MSGESLEHVLVVGAGLAGARSCEQLRRQGYEGRITLLGAETHPPYDRPPLSKDLLTGARADSALPVDFAALGVELRLGVTATGLRPADRVVLTSDGDIPYDGLVIATGSRPRELPGTGSQWTLRTLEDAHRLRKRLEPGVRVAIAGAGWIGAEVATAALASGCEVVCLSAGTAPFAGLFGADVAARMLPWWDGVDLRLGCLAESVTRNGVRLSDGSVLTADVVVTGIGDDPETGWLENSGLDLDRGVLVDEWLRAAPGIVAVGDVAAWWSRRWARRLHVRHWDHAASAPAVAVAALLKPGLCEVEPYDPVPYFWSDQFGHKLQYAGLHDAGDPATAEEGESGWWKIGWADSEGRPTAALVVDCPRELLKSRLAIGHGRRSLSRL
ncbi:NAD(P)/FAD-dependent oxidoreductase [Amycolatopsis echigonensis]|uniref:FAD-dependent oxidoreductase n=1 Tax=Amycolatopsis echigonensis TaxID=2576905 RepID=A0A8E2B8I2_9PSEU|nr:FAD-dependent oxidoreductase [Amycolatopsis echigonensis]MBB2504435.1 FAD-dependent oxidoreductase [Amycolatopsis echigonensis]